MLCVIIIIINSYTIMNHEKVHKLLQGNNEVQVYDYIYYIFLVGALYFSYLKSF